MTQKDFLDSADFTQKYFLRFCDGILRLLHLQILWIATTRKQIS
ncbi:hypothetical protein ACWIUD_07210 [Helicobacter sp. 23-1044]